MGQCHPSPLPLPPALPRARCLCGLSYRYGDGNRWRERREVLHDGRGSSACSGQALASNLGPGSHARSQLTQTDPNLATLHKEQDPQQSFLFSCGDRLHTVFPNLFGSFQEDRLTLLPSLSSQTRCWEAV